ncbi:peptidoglycan DD-metalloendopeptidase family protein [Actinotalea sp. AC32]|nr:peptidoglycan DD-metalloendopeptidase family protein [Actinotalea sp. AC32]
MTAPSSRRRRRLRAALVAVLAAATLGTGVLAPATADDLEDQRRAAEDRQRANQGALEDIQADIHETDTALAQAEAELASIQAQIPGAIAALQAAEDELARLQREAALIAERLVVAEEEEASISTQIDTDADRADDIRVAIGQMARDAYKGDMAASTLSAVLDARTTEEFVQQSELASTALRAQTQALRDLEQLNGVNRNRQARLTAVREEIVVLKAEADAKVVEAEQARAAAEAAKVALEELQAAEQQRVAAIEAKRAEQVAKQAELAAQQRQLESDLQAIIARQEEERRRQEEERRRLEEERRRAAEEAARNNQPPPPPVAAPPSTDTSGSSPLSWPSPMNPPYITSSYGWRLHPVLGYRRLHAGTDFRAYCGTPIISAGDGKVEWAYMRGGYGNQVMINHGYHNGQSLMTSYNHLSSFAVRSGQWVSRGQVVGYSGTTGTSTACHLHFEVYVNGGTVDPMNWLP